MKKKIRDLAPFIILAYSFVFAVLSYFDFFYKPLYPYLSQMVGFSIFTNFFMYCVYMNKRYCTSTKICVIGLISLNIVALICHYLVKSSDLYDIFLIIIIFLVLLFLKSE